MQLEQIMRDAEILITKYGLDPAAYEDDALRTLIKEGWSFWGVAEGLFEAATPNGVLIGPMTTDEIFWAGKAYAAALKTKSTTSRP